MPGLVKQTTRTTQPQTAVSFSSSIPAPLEMWLPAVSNQGLVKGYLPSLEATFSFKQNYGGQGIQVSSTGRRYTQEIFNNTQNRAWLVVAYRNLSPSSTMSVVRKDGALTPVQESGGATVQCAQWTTGSGLTIAQYPSSALSLIQGKVNVFTGHGSSAGTFIALNNSQETSIASGHQILQTSVNPLCFGANEGGAEVATAWTIMAVIIWQGPSRANIPTREQLKSFRSNPWQIFQPDRSYLDAIYQERLTISPDESRWMGSQGRSTEITQVIQEHRTIRTQQPQTAVEIDWANPVTLGLTALNHAFGSLTRKVLGDSIRKTTYAGFQARTVTPYGISLAEPGNAEGLTIPGIGGDSGAEKAFLSVFWIKNGNVTSGSPFILSGNSGEVNFTNGNTKTILYWLNTAGERTIGFFNSWSNTHVTLANIADGLHVAIGCQRDNAPLLLFVDGVCVQSGNSPVSTYSQRGLATCSFRNPSIDTANIGTVLLRAYFENTAYNKARFLELSKNPWQIFKPHQKTLAYEQQTAKVDPPVAKVKAAKLVKHVRTQQPQTAVGIDWGNPVTRGLEVAYSPNSRYNLITKRLGNIVPSSGGQVNKYLSVSDQINIPLLKPFAFAGGFTFFGLASAESISAPAPPIFGLRSSTSSMSMCYKIWMTSFFGFDARNGAGDTPSTIAFPTTGKLVPCFVTYSNNVLKMFCNGQFFEIGRTLSAQIFTELEIHYKQIGPDIPNTGSCLAIASIWNRALSNAEIKSISDNPWQIFQPESKTVWVDA